MNEEVPTRPQRQRTIGAILVATLPTRVISGDDDQIVPLADSLQLGEAIAGAETAVLPDCGHLPQEECPGVFMQAGIPFVEQRPSGISN